MTVKDLYISLSKEKEMIKFLESILCKNVTFCQKTIATKNILTISEDKDDVGNIETSEDTVNSCYIIYYVTIEDCLEFKIYGSSISMSSYQRVTKFGKETHLFDEEDKAFATVEEFKQFLKGIL